MVETVQAVCRKAAGMMAAGLFRQAEDSLRALLAEHSGGTQADCAPAFQQLALAAHRQGRSSEAVALAEHALGLEPENPEAHFTLGVVLLRAERLDEAARAFRAALVHDGRMVEAHLNLGNVLKTQGETAVALNHYRLAVDLRPDLAEAHMNLGAALRAEGKAAEAVDCCRRALAINPALPGAYLNLANALVEIGRHDEAAEAYGCHLSAHPQDAGIWVPFGSVLRLLGRRDEALAAYETAVRLKPDDGMMRFERGLARLYYGDFAGGWPDYEFRWCEPELGAERPELAGPQWSGQDLAGRTIFVHAEQGYGDSLQFARYLPLLVERGAKVIFGGGDEMERLFRPLLSDRLVWFRNGELPPPYHFHSPLLSLPGYLGTRVETIPAQVPYLQALPDLVEHWRSRITALAPKGLRVGLVWSGRPTHPNDKRRSFQPEALAPLFQVPGVTLFSLQKDPRPGHLEALGQLGTIHPLGSGFADFADTAAALESLDLLISADTSVAHLAGALGRPVWTMIPIDRDWRWMPDRADSPWYPTMRLFFQGLDSDWAPVLGQVAQELGRFKAG